MNEDALDGRHEGSPSGRLAELLACERELADRLSATRAEASRRIEEARAAAVRAEAELEASLEEEAQRVRAEVRVRSQGRIHDMRAGAREQAGRFEGVGEKEVLRLADGAFRRLVGQGDGG